jgi:signal transduction histidine kinase
VQAIAAAHGGHVTVHSISGAGTTLRLWIPGNARPASLIDHA